MEGNSRSQHGSHVVCINTVLTGELAEHPKRRPERLLDRRGIQIAKGGSDFRRVSYHSDDVAECAATQNGASLAWETKAAINSRSPTDHSDGPRIAS